MYQDKFTGWRKARRSNGAANCVEVAFAADRGVGVRDAKQHGLGPVLEFPPNEWAVFIGGVKAGEFDQQ